MHPKFENPEHDLPVNDPRFVIMEAWADMHGLYRANYASLLQGIFADMEHEKVRQDMQRRGTSYPVELEARLQRELPELCAAIDTLRRALDRVSGWQVRWQHRAQGEIAGMTESEDGHAVYKEIVTGPDVHYAVQGWVVGNQVGADELLGGINAWIEVADDPAALKGSYFPLGDMFAVEFLPPAPAA